MESKEGNRKPMIDISKTTDFSLELFGPLSSSMRSDLLEQCRISFFRLGQPGTWLSGMERVAIAQEVRRVACCSICADKKKALSPNAVGESHSGNDALTPIIVDTVHRIVSDSGRLTENWFQELKQNGLPDGEFVELISVTVTTLVIDRLARGVGTPVTQLPDPQSGTPSKKQPPGASITFAWVPTVPLEAAEGDLKSHYQQSAGVDGKIPHVLQALSFVPFEQVKVAQLSNVLYLPTAAVTDPSKDLNRGISRPQMEWVATLVSSVNECYY